MVEMHSLLINNERYLYELHRGERRRSSLSIAIKDDGVFLVRASMYLPLSIIENYLIKAIPKLNKRKAFNALPYEDPYIYLFGEHFYMPSFFSLSLKEKNKFLKSKLEPYISARFMPYINIVGNKKEGLSFEIKPLKSAYGIFHYKNRKISFSCSLVHYAPHIIDSVIAHELVHDFVHSHSQSFYDRLLVAFPDYYQCRKALINHDYGGKDYLKK